MPFSVISLLLSLLLTLSSLLSWKSRFVRWKLLFRHFILFDSISLFKTSRNIMSSFHLLIIINCQPWTNFLLIVNVFYTWAVIRITNKWNDEKKASNSTWLQHAEVHSLMTLDIRISTHSRKYTAFITIYVFIYDYINLIENKWFSTIIYTDVCID